MNKHALHVIVWVVLALAAWRVEIGLLWMPLLVAAGYHAFRAVVPVSAAVAPVGPTFPEDSPVGELGRFVVDGDNSFGLFVKLGGDLVFVDIREDENLEERKARARTLATNVTALEKSLAAFRTRNTEFADRRIVYIGLHSRDNEQGEVFWEPIGYTLLKGVEFVDP